MAGTSNGCSERSVTSSHTISTDRTNAMVERAPSADQAAERAAVIGQRAVRGLRIAVGQHLGKTLRQAEALQRLGIVGFRHVDVSHRLARCLGDGGGKVGDVFGVYLQDAGVEARGRFIIDPDGIIQGFEVLTPPVGRNVMESIRQIQAFQHVRKTKGAEATPSGWKPGKPTLKPGPDLVGKVWEVWKTKMAFDD